LQKRVIMKLFVQYSNMLKKMVLSLVLLVAINGVARAQFFGFVMEGGKDKVSFPFEIHNNLIVIPVVIEGTLKVNFILDTGVRSGIIFEKTITDILDVNYARKISILGAGENRIVEALVASNMQLSLPGVDGYGQSVLVLMENYLRLDRHIGHPVHGIIGYDIFSRFVVDINYSRQVITLHDPDTYKPSNWRKTLPIEVIDTKPYVKMPVWIDDTTKVNGKFMLDTGASHAIVVHQDANERIYLPPKNISAVLGKGLTGNIHGHLTRVEKLKLGKYELEEVIASFPDEASYSDSLMHEERYGTLGGEVLSRFNITIDYINSQIHFRRNSKFREDFEYNMSGIELMTVGSKFNTIQVVNVREGSVGNEAGIMEGDTVIAINGYFGKNLTLKRAYALFNSKDGKNIRMTITREGVPEKKKFQLRREI